MDITAPGALPEFATGFSSLTRDKWIGLGLAISSSLAIGTSFIITKKGLIDAAERGSGLASDGHTYLQNPIWWAGMATMVVGEVANFAAYTFAPPILVTPLGALSVLIGAILASFILKEELGRIGIVGCTLCLVGTVIIVVNAPEDKEIKTVDEILNYAMQPAFMAYCLFVLVFAIYMIYRIVPRYGKRTPVVYVSICSLVGSISVMSVKGFGVALKLTLDGYNQFTHPSTYCFAIVVVVCILVQMHYFNKALDQFSTNIVNPIYYVMFTTSTILASFLLFRGFNTSGPAAAVSLMGGFVVIFMGVYLLNLNRLIDPYTQQPRMSLVTGEGIAGTGRLSEHRERLLSGENGMFNPRLSMSGGHGRSMSAGMSRSSLSLGGGVGGGGGGGGGSGSGTKRGAIYDGPGRGGDGRHSRRDSANSVLFSAYDTHESVGLTQLNEDSDEEDGVGGGPGGGARSAERAAFANNGGRGGRASPATGTRLDRRHHPLNGSASGGNSPGSRVSSSGSLVGAGAGAARAYR
ncbi:unnamed protein product [Tilletia controversa]|uniref:DUF803-domain-containing protein n=2 Tax=Tilletia TaxID=13289 RepID=A0A8X7MPP6_9BASI|nr:hypothetical protein CF336_g4330 [Tilletia laevis]KAE8195978.1 hypothetical protein CF328_g4276 [Tilletia controversa]KAE8259810.1 hypothetical protein A4X03_0g3985 [Tilletia caries]KAE8196948.1 hypothetical protein CF335_g4731 [Tilletia laevis]KAE8243439.1 hypothetical protein A4X06_0g6317 [Tilletia controversa]